MKYIVLLSILLSSCIAAAQDKPTVFIADMYVRVVTNDTVTCEKIKTIWGNLDERFCIGWPETGEHYCFEQTSSAIKHDNESILIMAIDVETRELYSIRFIAAEDGFSIWITNLNGSFPHIMASTTDHCR